MLDPCGSTSSALKTLTTGKFGTFPIASASNFSHAAGIRCSGSHQQFGNNGRNGAVVHLIALSAFNVAQH
jgi:hypothetical protein